jgi:hypothetical protein
MAITEYIRDVDRAILNKVFENTVWRVNKCLENGEGHFEHSCNFLYCNHQVRLSQWPRGLRRRSTAARLLRSWVPIPLGAWTFVRFECCVLSGRGLCDELIIRPEESYRLWRVVVCDLETSKEEAKSPLKGCEYKPTMGCDAERKKIIRCAETFWSPCIIQNKSWSFRKEGNYTGTILLTEPVLKVRTCIPTHLLWADMLYCGQREQMGLYGG